MLALANMCVSFSDLCLCDVSVSAAFLALHSSANPLAEVFEGAMSQVQKRLRCWPGVKSGQILAALQSYLEEKKHNR